MPKSGSRYSLNNVKNDSSTAIQIQNSNLDNPVRTSVLIVTETSAGEYHYECQVELMQLTITMRRDVYPITVISFCKFILNV